MLKFLIKGILRDRSRSLLPIIIITIGVTLTVLLSGYIRGMMGDMTDQNARFQTGHVKVITKPYLENMDQNPLDLAILDADELLVDLREFQPQMKWVSRINFGGLIDVPDENGDTKGQGPASGMAVDLLQKSSGELERLNIQKALVKGKVPTQLGEALIAAEFAEKLEVQLGDEVTYVGSTMNGSMSFKGFIVTGFVRFGNSALDQGAIIVDLGDAQQILDMENGATEILGYLSDEVYVDDKATDIAEQYNTTTDQSDEFAPVMITLKEQNNLGSYLDMVDVYSGLFVGIFVFAMSLVLWNTGLLGGLRRYQEFGIRLALGESKGKIYRRMILEATIIGIIGSAIGTGLGLIMTLYLQYNGIDISGLIDSGTMMMPSTLRAKFTPNLLYIGFIPGLFAMVIGTMLSGIGIYKRQTSVLFKELEV